MATTFRAFVTIIVVLSTLLPIAHAGVLLEDNFDGAALNTALWRIPDPGPASFLGRTQLRVSAPPEVSGGVVKLRLDSHNPTALTPGDSFLGSEIISKQVFNRGAGISVEARMRLLSPTHGGIVGGFFLYDNDPAPIVRDEITDELLSNQAVNGKHDLMTNAFDDAPFSSPGKLQLVDVPGLDLTAFNTYRIDWLPDRIRWLVNGQLVREELDVVPGDLMTLRFNIWATDPNFALAYDPSLAPVAIPEQNQTRFYEIDHVILRSIPEPSTPVLLLLGLVFMAAVRKMAAVHSAICRFDV
jgi:hypothetical protein